MARTEQMEWHQTPGNHVFDVFDTIPLIPLQSLPQARYIFFILGNKEVLCWQL
jgi:hypothetical protein